MQQGSTRLEFCSAVTLLCQRGGVCALETAIPCWPENQHSSDPFPGFKRHINLKAAPGTRMCQFPSAEGLRIMVHYRDTLGELFRMCSRKGVALEDGAGTEQMGQGWVGCVYVCAHLFCILKFREEYGFFQIFDIHKMKIRQKKKS